MPSATIVIIIIIIIISTGMYLKQPKIPLKFNKNL